MAICTSIVKLESYPDGIDMMRVTIDNEVQAYMLYSYAESLKFVNQEVIVSYRKDIYQGKIELFINTLTIPVKVSTLDREDRIKLYSKEIDNNSNVCLDDIREGETMIGAVLYCIETVYESSVRAVWMTLKVRDKAGRIAKLRLFDYENRDADFSGTYIKANIKRTQYGFNTEEVVSTGLDFAPNPEIKIARTYIERYFADDTFVRSLFSKTSLLDYMEEYIDLEKGYTLVRLAMELDVVEELKNIFDDINFRALTYAIVMRYGYVTKSKLNEYSGPLRAITFALQQKIPADLASLVLQILDVGEVDNMVPERKIYDKVIALVDSIIMTKKAV